MWDHSALHHFSKPSHLSSASGGCDIPHGEWGRSCPLYTLSQWSGDSPLTGHSTADALPNRGAEVLRETIWSAVTESSALRFLSVSAATPRPRKNRKQGGGGNETQDEIEREKKKKRRNSCADATKSLGVAQWTRITCLNFSPVWVSIP